MTIRQFEESNTKKYEIEKLEEKLKELIVKANSGDSEAQFYLGKFYSADNIKQGDSKAEEYFGKYYNPKYIKPNYSEAFKWYKQSAEQENEEAKEALARLGEK